MNWGIYEYTGIYQYIGVCQYIGVYQYIFVTNTKGSNLLIHFWMARNYMFSIDCIVGFQSDVTVTTFHLKLNQNIPVFFTSDKWISLHPKVRLHYQQPLYSACLTFFAWLIVFFYFIPVISCKGKAFGEKCILSSTTPQGSPF